MSILIWDTTISLNWGTITILIILIWFVCQMFVSAVGLFEYFKELDFKGWICTFVIIAIFYFFWFLIGISGPSDPSPYY